MDMKASCVHLRKKAHIFSTMRLIKKIQKGMMEFPFPGACCLIQIESPPGRIVLVQHKLQPRYRPNRMRWNRKSNQMVYFLIMSLKYKNQITLSCGTTKAGINPFPLISSHLISSSAAKISLEFCVLSGALYFKLIEEPGQRDYTNGPQLHNRTTNDEQSSCKTQRKIFFQFQKRDIRERHNTSIQIP